MAEAGAGVAGPRTQSKFFCYKCSQEISHVLEDFTCPICKGGFIEEVQQDAGSRNSTTSTNASAASSGAGGPYGLDGGFDFLQMLARSLQSAGGGGAGGSGNQGGGNSRSPAGPGNFQRTRSEGSDASNSPGTQHHNFSFVVGPGGVSRGNGQSNPNLSNNPMDQMLFTFLNELMHGLGGGVAGTVDGPPLLANFGDYAWGRDGLDAIVTQLMNQMEGSGPPPLTTDKIETLPDVSIGQEQVDQKLQCSVCWDDFSLGELVKKLDCDHVYHPDCIIPWLKLHGTCPICRKELSGQEKDDSQQNPSPRFEPMEREPSATNIRRADNSSSASLNASTRPTDTSSSFTNIGRAASSNSSNSDIPGANPFQHTNPIATLMNAILEPILTGDAGTRRQNSGNQPSTGQGGRGGQQGSGGPGSEGFDHMDLDFD